MHERYLAIAAVSDFSGKADELGILISVPLARMVAYHTPHKKPTFVDSQKAATNRE
jgi:hypothetical protein